MSMKMKKNWSMVGASLALTLASVLVGLAACQNGITSEVDFLPLPLELPYGDVVEDGASAGTGFTTYSFTLEWKRSPGILYRNAVYDTEEEVKAAMDQALAKWQDYIRRINPRPFYDTAGDGMAPGSASNSDFAVFVTGTTPQLDNASTAPANGKIVIHRYWPAVIPTRTAWLDPAVEAARVAAFKKAVADIEAMMADIEASPFYNTGLPAHASLMDLHQAMADTIAYNPDVCTQRVVFDVDFTGGGNGVAEINPAATGFLYEYYLGHVPPPGEYTNAAPLALPE